MRPALARALATLVWGVAACSAATTPSPIQPTGSTAQRTTAAVPSSAASASPTRAPSSPGPESGELALEVGTIDPAWTSPLLEFASDGDAIIFSSGVADGPDGEATPDLWRYTPGTDAPELLWRNPRRDRSLVRIGGELGLWAFVETPLDGTRAWDLWLLTAPGAEAVRLDTHPGDADVSSLVPSFDISENEIVWTAFDRGPDGPVSQLLAAHGPDWEPQLLAERRAEEAELWLPSLWGSQIAYCEVRYAEDRSTDERHVYLLDRQTPSASPTRIDTSGLATMPMLVNNDLVWKETDPGFSMFNWGRLMRYDLYTGETGSVSMRPQPYVNYPSAGYRFIAAWGADAFTFTVHDLELKRSRLIERYDADTSQNVLRPHLTADLLVWMYTREIPGDEEVAELRYAFLPAAGTDRGR